MQRELAVLAEMTRELKRLDAKLVAQCKTEQESFRLCRRASQVHYTDESLADLLGISTGHLNQLLNSDHNKRERHMSRKLGNRLQRICGNRAINQWADLELDGLLDCQRSVDDKLAEAKALVAELEQQRAN